LRIHGHNEQGGWLLWKMFVPEIRFVAMFAQFWAPKFRTQKWGACDFLTDFWSLNDQFTGYSEAS
jgi:hypothetical protein